MKVIYSKFNSERHPAFQLSTLIYEDNSGTKYVKKQTLNPKAEAHLSQIKSNYEKLSATIQNHRIKLAKIVDKDPNSVTFEYIEGYSFEQKLHNANGDEKAIKNILEEYYDLLLNGFQSISFDSSTMLTPTHKILFGDMDFSLFDGEKAFKGISNLDMIFSNIIFKDNDIYLIDYEWSYEIALPISYILFRTVLTETSIPQTIKEEYIAKYPSYAKMERHFIDNYVMQNGFYFYRRNYIKVNYSVLHHLQEKDSYINRLSKRIYELDNQVQKIGDELFHARTIVAQRDQKIKELLYTFCTKHYIKKALQVFSQHGAKKLIAKIKHTFSSTLPQQNNQERKEENVSYSYHPPVKDENILKTLDSFEKKPLISIIMPVYNINPKWLNLAIESIESQWYDNWELCIADDKSTNPETLAYLKGINNPKIKTTYLDTNLNISGASNAAIELATGEYIALMDNDDEITPDALFEIVKAINKEDPDFIYSDEDFIDTEGNCHNPHYKPDFSPDLLLSHNYITHLSCFKKSLLDKVGYFDPRFDGSQDYDLFLRMTEQTSNIYHIPKVLYHWRMLESSTSSNAHAKPEAIEKGRQVLEETLKRRKIDAKVENGNMPHYFRIRYTIHNSPLVSIIIPFKDKPELLQMCITSILKKSTYQKYEIIGISNNSENPKTFELMNKLEQLDSRIKFYEYNTEFNYADINNHAVNTYAKGEHILLLNNDIEVISPDWIESMLEHSQRKEIGCVGAKLYFPNDKIQHAGIIIGLGGYAGHSHKMYSRFNPGYFNRLMAIQNLSAVTAACLMVKRTIYDEVNGLDAVNFKVAYNDVDFCLRVREKGYLNLFTPYAELYHHESISRGYETTPEKIARFQTEKDALFNRHKQILTNGDPYYNPNLCHDKEDFSICPKQ